MNLLVLLDFPDVGDGLMTLQRKRPVARTGDYSDVVAFDPLPAADSFRAATLRRT